MDPNNTPDDPTTVSEPEVNNTAAFLFGDEPDVQADLPTSEPTQSSITQDPADLARQAQTQVEPPTVITPAQEATILASQTPAVAPPQQQSMPSIDLVGQQQAVAPVQPAKVVEPPTQDEINKQLNVYNLDERDYDSIFDTEDKAQSIQALNAVLQKAVKQAVTMSHVLIQEQAQQLQQQVQPYMQFADEQRTSVLHTAFYERHKELATAQPVVDAVLKQFQSQGVKFQSHEQLFDAVAQNTKAYLVQMQQLGQTVAPAQQGPNRTQGTPASGKPRMAALPSGGQGGAGASGGKSGTMSTAQALFS